MSLGWDFEWEDLALFVVDGEHLLFLTPPGSNAAFVPHASVRSYWDAIPQGTTIGLWLKFVAREGSLESILKGLDPPQRRPKLLRQASPTPNWDDILCPPTGASDRPAPFSGSVPVPRPGRLRRERPAHLPGKSHAVRVVLSHFLSSLERRLSPVLAEDFGRAWHRDLVDASARPVVLATYRSSGRIQWSWRIVPLVVAYIATRQDAHRQLLLPEDQRDLMLLASVARRIETANTDESAAALMVVRPIVRLRTALGLTCDDDIVGSLPSYRALIDEASRVEVRPRMRLHSYTDGVD